MNNSNTISSFDKFALDPSMWLYFGETQWDEAIAPEADNKLQYGWVETVKENTLTFQRIKRTNKRELRPRTEEVLDVVLRAPFPVIAAQAEELKTLLKLCVCLKPEEKKEGEDADETSASLVQLCVFVNREGVQSTWSKAGTIPCFGDLFRILTFFCVWVPHTELSPLVPVLKTIFCTSEADSREKTLEWMKARDDADTTPVVFHGMPNAALFRIPDTPIVMDTRSHSVYDVTALGSLPCVPCSGGVLVGPPGSGKFSTCIALVSAAKVEVSASCALVHRARTQSCATLLLVPAEGLSWRYMQLRKQQPDAIVIRITCKADLLKVTWGRILAADFVLVSYQFVNTKPYLDHMHHVLSSISHYPETLLPETLSVRCTKRRRVVKVVPSPDAADVQEDIPGLDSDLCSSKKTSVPHMDEEFVRFAAECTRRVLQKTAVRFEGLTAPVLEVFSFRRIVFVDSDRQSMSMHRLKAFEGDTLWATACKHPAKNASLTLPHSVHVIPNATAKQYLVAREMTCALRPEDSLDAKTAVHTEVPMTLREALEKKQYHFEPAVYEHLLNVIFVKKISMGEEVLAVARQQVDNWTVKRDILRTDIERAAAARAAHAAEVAAAAANEGTAAAGAGTGADVFVIDLDPFLLAVADDDEEYDFFNDDDDDDDDDDEEEDDDDADEDDGDDDDEDDEGDDDEYPYDDDDDEDLFQERMEEALLELTPERMTLSMDNLTAQIDAFQRDEAALIARIASGVREVIGCETCLICSNYTCNAMLPCAHSFCVDCLLKWQESKKSCPACNTAGMKIIAQEEGEELRCPMPDYIHFWTRVWSAQTLSSQVFWFMATLSNIAVTGTKAVIITKTAADSRALAHALRNNDFPVRNFTGSPSARYDTLCRFRKKHVHVIVQMSDVLAGAGFGSTATDVVFAEPGVAADANVLARFHACLRVHTHARIRSSGAL
jgi:hypothetical protein